MIIVHRRRIDNRCKQYLLISRFEYLSIGIKLIKLLREIRSDLANANLSSIHCLY